MFSNEPTIVFNLRDYLLVLAQIFSQQAICYCESKCPIELINASLGEDFNKTQDSFSDIKFSTPNQLEQSLNALKNKISTFFLKHPDKHNGMEFNEIAKTQIEALYMPQSSDDFDDFRKDLEYSIKSFIRAKKIVMVFLKSLMLQTQNKKRGKSLNGEKKIERQNKAINKTFKSKKSLTI